MVNAKDTYINPYRKEVKELLEYYKSECLNVIPLRYGKKKPIGGWKDYQTRKISKEEIEQYFHSDEPHNVGIVCGEISDNLFVIDFDDPELFDKFFPEKEELVYVKTGRGYHVYLKAKNPVKTLKLTDSKGREVVTLKGEGGYVVAPPSLHESGAQYEFIQRSEIPRLEGDPRQHVKERAEKLGLVAPKDTIDMEHVLKGVPEGNRDNALTYLVHYLRRSGVRRENAQEICQEWNGRNNPPLSADIIKGKIEYHYSLPEPYNYFYTTDPTYYIINADLELKKIAKNTAEDVFYLDGKGRRRLNWETLLENICREYAFKTLDDTEQVLLYDNGIYRSGYTTIKAYMEQVLGFATDRHIVSEMVAHVQRRTYTPRSVFNADSRYVPILNGLLNLETLVLDDFSPDMCYTFRLPVEYDPTATYTHIEGFFRDVLHSEDIKAMQEFFGYCLYPGHPAHKIMWWLGHGRNGKTTTGNLLKALVGTENDAGVPLKQLDGNHRFAVARLFGKLVNIIPEPETRNTLQTPTLKSATGGDSLFGERKGVQDTFVFTNIAKFIVYANSVPRIEDASFAFWERVIVLDFPHEFTGTEAKKDYYKTLIEQDGLSGLLNWALIGLKRLRENNWEFTETTAQQKAKGNMKRRSQPVSTFVGEWTEFDNRVEIQKTCLFDAFKIYCDVYGLLVPSEGEFTRELKRSARVREKKMEYNEARVRGWQGIKIKEDIEVVIPYIKGEQASADEISGAKEVDVEFKTYNLADYITCPTCPTCPTFSDLTYIGEKRVIFENKEIIPLYKRSGITPANPANQDTEKTTVPENEGLKEEGDDSSDQIKLNEESAEKLQELEEIYGTSYDSVGRGPCAVCGESRKRFKRSKGDQKICALCLDAKLKETYDNIDKGCAIAPVEPTVASLGGIGDE